MPQMSIIRARDLIKAIRGGMTASQVMKKYRLSTKTMRLVFRQLLDADAVTKAELDECPTLYQCSIPGNVRRARRRRITFPLQIFDNGDPLKNGFVRNISEKGVCIEGMTTKVGDVKDFIIRSGNFYQGFSLVFDAGCRWVKREGLDHKAGIVAGFEITNISAMDSKELQRLLPQRRSGVFDVRGCHKIRYPSSGSRLCSGALGAACCAPTKTPEHAQDVTVNLGQAQSGSSYLVAMYTKKPLPGHQEFCRCSQKAGNPGDLVRNHHPPADLTG